jgi:hypothetical protein
MPAREDKTSIGFLIHEERKEEIDQAVEEGTWQNRAAYLRHMIAAGESNVAALDPRTDSESNSQDSSGNFVTDKDIISELVRLTEDREDDFVGVDELAEDFVKEIKSDITDRVYRMANDDGSRVITDKQGGYAIKKDE